MTPRGGGVQRRIRVLVEGIRRRACTCVCVCVCLRRGEFLRVAEVAHGEEEGTHRTRRVREPFQRYLRWLQSRCLTFYPRLCS